jgi:hypothetical protein
VYYKEMINIIILFNKSDAILLLLNILINHF